MIRSRFASAGSWDAEDMIITNESLSTAYEL